MLQELIVKNFAIIDSLHIRFEEGLNILSGETGAGKSIIVGALGLLMGGRAFTELIRTEKEEAVVEAVFDISTCPDVRERLHLWDITPDDQLLIIRRKISRNGKSRIFIGERLGTLQMLSQIGTRLIDISGQYSQQLLLQTERHIDILDAVGNTLHVREQYCVQYKDYVERLNELKSLLKQEDERIKQKELCAFQYDEIGKANLYQGEEEELLREKNILTHANNLYEKTFGGYDELYERDGACLSVLKKIARDVADASHIDKKLSVLTKQLESAVISLEDSAFALRDYAENIQMDPGRLEMVESRLDEINRLKKKYGPSIEKILLFKDTIQQQIRDIEGNTHKIDHLREELSSKVKQLWSTAEQLSEKRTNTAMEIKKLVEKELASIGMKKTSFFTKIKKHERTTYDDVTVALNGLTATGRDTVEFFITPNAGEDPKPLSRIASGGEISRIVLALKKILAGNYRVATLMFDEVDAGIGGAVAEAVGAKLKEIAQSHQVLCITHLPQIACFGDQHYSVTKGIHDRRTVTQVVLLDEPERVEEISRMLGGRKISEKTRDHAREMMKNAQKCL